MAFNKDGLYRQGQGGYVAALAPNPRLSLWHYATTDAAAAVEAANYFPAKIDQAAAFVKGDVIQVVAAAGGTPVLKAYIVTAVGATACTIAAQTVA